MSRSHLPFALAVTLALGLGATACSRSEAASAAAPAATAPAATPPAQVAGTAPGAAAGLPRLVFFMNPNGRPCQIQDQILEQVAGSLQGRAVLVRFRTTTPEDLAWFDKFGIRSLPQLVVTDATGRELRRATPGIQDAGQVLQLLAP
jgi:thioredoxin 1